MTESPKPLPPKPLPPEPAPAETARSARLRDALRENLKRRKSQARGRAAVDMSPANDDPAPGGAGAVDDNPTPKL
jgi:hypothetical protein